LQCGRVGAGGGDVEAKRLAIAREVKNFRGINQNFRRHAAAQDAQAAEFGCAIDDGDLGPGGLGSAGTGIPGTATTDDNKIKGLGHDDKGRSVFRSIASG
jgi:hypothetical protein